MMRRFSQTVWPLRRLLLATAVLALAGRSWAAVLSCQTIVLPMEGRAAYKGWVRNEQYRFSAVIPPGKTGWGVREPAPFHGFVVFLDADGRYREGDSCINLEVGVRVVLPEDDLEEPTARTVGRPVTVGHKKGLEIVGKQALAGRRFVVVTVNLDLPRAVGESDYVSVTLISPEDRYPINKKIFERFLADLTFK